MFVKTNVRLVNLPLEALRAFTIIEFQMDDFMFHPIFCIRQRARGR